MKIIIQLKAENAAEVVIFSFIPQRRNLTRNSKKKERKEFRINLIINREKKMNSMLKKMNRKEESKIHT
jgi:hypothetical protein